MRDHGLRSAVHGAAAWPRDAVPVGLLCPLLYFGGVPYTPMAVMGATVTLLTLAVFEALAVPAPEVQTV